jgi:hypothetical protein
MMVDGGAEGEGEWPTHLGYPAFFPRNQIDVRERALIHLGAHGVTDPVQDVVTYYFCI